jgi:hypothetical protein
VAEQVHPPADGPTGEWTFMRVHPRIVGTAPYAGRAAPGTVWL